MRVAPQSILCVVLCILLAAQSGGAKTLGSEPAPSSIMLKIERDSELSLVLAEPVSSATAKKGKNCPAGISGALDCGRPRHFTEGYTGHRHRGESAARGPRQEGWTRRCDCGLDSAPFRPKRSHGAVDDGPGRLRRRGRSVRDTCGSRRDYPCTALSDPTTSDACPSQKDLSRGSR